MKLVDESIEEIIDISREYMGKLRSMSTYSENDLLLARKVETQIQNTAYFCEGLKEHIIQEVN